MSGNGDDFRYRAVTSELEEFKRTVTTVLDKMVVQAERDRSELRTQMERDRDLTRSEIKALAEKGQPKIQIILAICFGVFGIITTLVGAGYYVTSQQTQLLATPLAIRAEVSKAAQDALEQRLARIESDGRDLDKTIQLITAQNRGSEIDRANHGARLDRLAEQLGTLSGRVIANSSAITEVETQFRADELIASQRESNTEQWKGVFFQKLYDVPLPSRGPVVPGIARSSSHEGG